MIRKIVLGVVVLVHLGMLMFLFSSPDREERGAVKEKAVPAAESAEVSDAPAPEQALPEEKMPAAPGSGQPLMPQAEARKNAAPGPAVVQQPYSAGYFADLNKTLPSSLRRDASLCQAAGIFDLNTHTCLWSRNADQAVPIASLTKMMTALLLMEDLAQGRNGITMNTMVQVSRAASKIGGRQVWLDPRETFSVEDLLKAMMIRSANDCAYQLGEFLGGGNIASFVTRMNQRAAQLNCRHFRFHNCHGLPTDRRQENTGSVNELAYLAERLWQYPELIKWTGTRMDVIRENTKPFQLVSTNHLLRTCPGTVGLKTGMTNKAGYCLVAICERENRKVIAVVLGVSAKAGGYRLRDRVARKLIDWCFANPL